MSGAIVDDDHVTRVEYCIQLVGLRVLGMEYDLEFGNRY